jgi:hypothetical protein
LLLQISSERRIARRLFARPELLEIAKENLARWMERDGEIPPWRAWRHILSQPVAEVIEVLLSRDEKARHLRESSPFCGLLTPKERWRIYESFTVRAYYQGDGQHRR